MTFPFPKVQRASWVERMSEQEDEVVGSEKLILDMAWLPHISAHSSYGHTHKHEPVNILAWRDETPLLGWGIIGSCWLLEEEESFFHTPADGPTSTCMLATLMGLSKLYWNSERTRNWEGAVLRGLGTGRKERLWSRYSIHIWKFQRLNKKKISVRCSIISVYCIFTDSRWQSDS